MYLIAPRNLAGLFQQGQLSFPNPASEHRPKIHFYSSHLSHILQNTIVIAFCLIASLSTFLIMPANSQEKFAEIVKSYVELAFPDGEGKLRKFVDASHVTYGTDCFADNEERCKEALALFPSAVFESANMQAEFSLSGKVRFAFATENSLPYLREKMSNVFSRGISDAADLDCQLYMFIKDNQTTAAAIVVSLDSPIPKRVVCMLVNFSRVLGLAQIGNAPFSQTWPHNRFSKEALTYTELMSSPDFLTTLNAVRVLSYIHACRATRPGMSKSAVIAELTTDSVCVRELGVR